MAIAVVVVYLILMVVIGNVSTRRAAKRTLSEGGNYFGGSLPPWVMATAVVATSISGVGFIGTPGQAYNQGYSIYLATTILGGGWLGFILSAKIIGRPMKRIAARRKLVTVTDIVCDIFQDQRLRYAIIPIIILGGIAAAAVQWVVIGTVMSNLLGVDYKLAVIIGVACVALYSVLGGNESTALVGAIQCLIALFCSTFMAFTAVKLAGGLTNMNNTIASVDSSLFYPVNTGTSFGYFFSTMFIYSVGFMGQPHITVKWSQITDNKLYPKAILIGVVSYALTTLMTYVGVASRAMVEQGAMAAVTNTDSLVMIFIQTFCSPWVVGLVVAAALSAIMSTGAAYLISCSSACVNDVMANWAGVDMSGKKGKRISQIATLLCLLLSLAMSFRPDLGIQALGNAAWGAFAAVITPSLVLGLRWRRATKQGALASSFFGLAIVVVVNILKYTNIWLWPFQLSMEAFALIMSFVIMIVVSLLTPAQDKSHFMPETLAELKARKAAAEV